MSALIDQIIEILLSQAESYQGAGLVVCKKTNTITVIGYSQKIKNDHKYETKDPKEKNKDPKEEKKDVLDKNGNKLSQDECQLQFEIAEILLETAKEYEDIGLKVNRKTRTISFDDQQLGLKLVDQQICLIKSEI